MITGSPRDDPKLRIQLFSKILRDRTGNVRRVPREAAEQWFRREIEEIRLRHLLVNKDIAQFATLGRMRCELADYARVIRSD